MLTKELVAVLRATLMSAGPDSAAAISHHLLLNPVGTQLVKLYPVTEALMFPLLLTGTPRERHTMQGDEKPPLPSPKPHALKARTERSEELALVTYMPTWSRGIGRLSVGEFVEIVWGGEPRVHWKLVGGLPETTSTVADIMMLVPVNRLLIVTVPRVFV